MKRTASLNKEKNNHESQDGMQIYVKHFASLLLSARHGFSGVEAKQGENKQDGAVEGVDACCFGCCLKRCERSCGGEHEAGERRNEQV